MVNIKLLSFLLFLTPLGANATISSADQLINDMTSQQSPAEALDVHVYNLVTPPSLNKKKVESTFKKIRAEIPKAEIRNKIEERLFYRLVVRCFDNIAPAKSLQADLTKSSRTPFILQENNTYCVVASSQMTHEAAVAEQKQLAAKQISAHIVELNLPLPHWQVKSGNYHDLRDAVNMANSMSMKGLITTIEPLEDGAIDKSQEILDRLMSQEILNSAE